MATEIVVQKTETALAPWEQRMADMAKEAAASEKVLGSFIGLQSGVLTIAGDAVKGNKLPVVVLAYTHEHALYEGQWDPANKTPPVCFAFGTDEAGMAPHPSSTKPQHESCAACPQNAFGSAPTGKGKACNNRRRLAVMAASDLNAKDLPRSEVMYLRVPPTSGKDFGIYVKEVATLSHRPLFGVVTEVGTSPHPKHQFHVTFNTQELVPVELLQAMEAKATQAQEDIDFPYEPKAEGTAPSNPEISPAGNKRKF